jgi:hypothetical protein
MLGRIQAGVATKDGVDTHEGGLARAQLADRCCCQSGVRPAPNDVMRATRTPLPVTVATDARLTR